MAFGAGVLILGTRMRPSRWRATLPQSFRAGQSASSEFRQFVSAHISWQASTAEIAS